MTHVVSTSIAEPSENFRLASSVAQLGMLLRNSPHKGDAAFETITPIAAEDFVEVVQMAEALR
jgi:hypothetical protein